MPDHTHTLTLGYAAGEHWGRRDAKWGGDDVTDSSTATATVTNASDSSAIYGKSNTVQPPAIKVRVVTRYK